MNGIVSPTAQARMERFQYASLYTQVVNILATAKEKNIEVPYRDECLQQAGRNLLAWLNRTADED